MGPFIALRNLLHCDLLCPLKFASVPPVTFFTVAVKASSHERRKFNPQIPEARACPSQASAAAALLAEALSLEEWATFSHVMALLRAALKPAAAQENGLALPALAALLAEAWFPPLPPLAAAGALLLSPMCQNPECWER